MKGTLGKDSGALPIAFLYRHALELYIKTVISLGSRVLRSREIACASLDSLHKTHVLTEFLPDVRRILAEAGWSWDCGVDRLRNEEDFVSLIQEFDTIDKKSDSFRYPTDTAGGRALPIEFCFDVTDFVGLLDPLLDNLDGTVVGLSELLRSEAEAAAEEFGR